MRTPSEVYTDFQKTLKTIPDKKQQVREIVEFSIVYGDCFNFKIISLLEKGIELAREIGDKAGETLCYCNIAFTNRVTGISVPTRFAVEMQELTQMVDDIKYDAESYTMGLNMLSYFHWFRGEYEIAFNLAFESLNISEQKQIIGVGWNNFGLAVFYFDTKDFENARKHYQRALETFNSLNHQYGKARASNGLGTVAIAQHRIDEAIPFLEYSHGIYKEMGHFAGLSRAATDMGLLEKRNANYPKAIEHLRESLELRTTIDHVQGCITTYTELGETFLLMKEFATALEYLEKGLNLATELKTHQKKMRLHKLMYDTLKELKETELALFHFEKYFEVKSQILSDEAANNIKKVQTRYEKEKSEKEAELERFKNVELKKANAIIEQKNKDITDSINYAKRIQLAILPHKEILDNCFEDYFVLYKPKDIVSGDFYWAVRSESRQTGNNLSIIAAVDCTGHGVPGAFMSMLANTLLNQTITNPKIVTAADVLTYLNHKLPENLKSKGEEQNIRDGMDMTLCIFDFKNMKMQFAGAGNPCWVIRNNDIIEIKGDKQAISASTDTEKKDFTNHVFDLKKNDLVYLFTDGYADQFGGPNEKKLSYKRMRELLITNNGFPLRQQKQNLLNAFENWRGSLEQVDDVCLIGIRV